MLSDLERECLEVYRRKVDEAANTKARLHQSVASKEAELATLMAALGELNIQPAVTKKSKIGNIHKLTSMFSSNYVYYFHLYIVFFLAKYYSFF